MRQAANNAIDRPGMLRVRGAYAGKRTVQILPPGMGGFQRTKAYPLTGPNYAKAKQLAGSNCKSVNLWTANSADRREPRPGLQVQPEPDRL